MKRLAVVLVMAFILSVGLSGCASAEFEVGSLFVTPGEIVADEAFTVEAGVTNIGENDGTFTATLKLDERVFDKKKVMVAAGATETVRFDCIVETPGIHSLELNNSTTTFTALKRFEVGSISVTPSEIVAGEAFTVEAGVTNIGRNEGTFTATLTLDEEVVDKKEVWIEAGGTGMVQFDCIAETPGTHTLKLVDSSATFVALRPADFEVTSLSIPTEAYTREPIVIEANVTNTGEAEGFYDGHLMVEGTEKASSHTPIATGTTETISFTMTIDTPGTYTITLDEATATLTVLLTFPDSNLEAAVRETINKPEGPIYMSDLFPVIELAAMGKGISDLTGLEYCVNLVELQVGDNNISDLSPLAGLTNLRALGLGGNSISDLSLLAGFTSLQALWLGDNNISNLSPLAGLIDLQRLWLHANPHFPYQTGDMREFRC